MPDSPAAPSTVHFAWKSIPWLAVLAGIMLLQIWFPRVDAPQLNDTYNVDVGGRNAFFQFTERRAGNVSRSLRSLSRLATDLPSDATICILGPARAPTDLEWNILLSWVNRGGRLLYASRWEEPAITIPFLNVKVVATADSIPGNFHQFQKANAKNPSPTGGDNPPGVTPPGAGSPKNQVAPIAPPVVPVGPEIVQPAPVVADLGNPKFPLLGVDWQSIGKIEASRGELLLGTEFSKQVVRLPYGNGSIIVAASDHLFSNKSLYDKSHRNGVLAAQLLEAAGVRRESTVVFDESLNMTGTPRRVGRKRPVWDRPPACATATARCHRPHERPRKSVLAFWKWDRSAESLLRTIAGGIEAWCTSRQGDALGRVGRRPGRHAGRRGAKTAGARVGSVRTKFCAVSRRRDGHSQTGTSARSWGRTER
ncbi:MAG: DUF4350 domain-containing protein [Planctomycetota bacterium]|nr:DUF4350 domain-containing protein [Planctomycetota bacterium]